MREKSLLLKVSLLILLLFIPLTAGSREREQFMFLDELQPGMEGICKTVIKGNVITTFNFTVVDILASEYVGGAERVMTYHNIILARAGEGIEEAGGIASGMSGSPCYIDDKLIGALFASPSWETTLNEPEPTFLIQPIEQMLPVLDACKQKAAAAPTGTAPIATGYLPPQNKEVAVSSLTGSTNVEKIRFTTDQPSPEEVEANPSALFVRVLTTPVTVTGLSERAFNRLREGADEESLGIRRSSLHYIRGEEMFGRFLEALSQGVEERYDVQLYNLGGPGQVSGVDPGPLEPGGPVGDAIMLGGINYGGYGTVTYIEDQCLIAYGHPSFLLGDTDTFMTSAYVVDTVKSIQGPWKQGYLVEEIGSVVQDTFPAIGGAIGKSTEAIQFNIKVTDKDSGKIGEFKSRSVALTDWYPSNLLIAGLEAVDRTLGRIGQGTLNMHLTIKGAGLPKPLERRDIFVDNVDIATAGAFDPAWISYVLAWNEFADPQIGEVDLDIAVEKSLRVKVIEDVEPGQLTVSEGGVLPYTVRLQPYRGAQEVIEGSLSIPSWAGGDFIYLGAFPARDAFWRFEMAGPWIRPVFLSTILDIDGLIEAVEGAPTNDLMIVVAWSLRTGGAYAIDIKSVGDWVVDGDRESRYAVAVADVVGLNVAPMVDFTFSPVEPVVGEEVQFSDRSIDLDGYIVYWGWDFGDGTICPKEPSSCGAGDSRNPTHVFIEPRVYRVAHVLIDEQGAISKVSKEIKVSVARS